MHVNEPGYRPFVVIGLARSGTTLVGRALDATEDVRCYGEIMTTKLIDDAFSPPEAYLRWRRASPEQRRPELHPIRRKIDYLDELVIRRPPARITGFKLTYNQLSFNRVGNAIMYRLPYSARGLYSRSFLAWLARNEVKVVHVVRDNVLEILVSMSRAAQTGIYHSTASVPSSPFVLRTRNLAFRLRQLSHSQLATGRLLSPFERVTVRYEDRWEETTARISELLGLPAFASTTPTLKKLSDSSLRESLSNFEEVKHVLSSTEFAPLLERR